MQSTRLEINDDDVQAVMVDMERVRLDSDQCVIEHSRNKFIKSILSEYFYLVRGLAPISKMLSLYVFPSRARTFTLSAYDVSEIFMVEPESLVKFRSMLSTLRVRLLLTIPPPSSPSPSAITTPSLSACGVLMEHVNSRRFQQQLRPRRV